MYFGNYRRLIYLAQTEDAELQRQRRASAPRASASPMNIALTGLGGLARLRPHGAAPA